VRIKKNIPVKIVDTPAHASDVGICATLSQIDNTDYYHNRVHFHYFYELELVIEGSGICEINHISLPIQKGALFLVTPADFHRYTLNNKSTMRYYNIQFPVELLSDEMGDTLYSFTNPIHLILTDAEYTFFNTRLSELIESYYRKSYLYEKLLKHEIESLCIHIIQMLSNRVSEESRNGAIKKAIVYIKKNYARTITLNEVSAHVGLSTCYFSSLFSSYMEVGFADYVRSFRLNVAANLIKSTDMTLSEISDKTGFKTFSYFSTQFRKVFNMPPKEYRVR